MQISGYYNEYLKPQLIVDTQRHLLRFWHPWLYLWWKPHLKGSNWCSHNQGILHSVLSRFEGFYDVLSYRPCIFCSSVWSILLMTIITISCISINPFNFWKEGNTILLATYLLRMAWLSDLLCCSKRTFHRLFCNNSHWSLILDCSHILELRR